MPWFLCSDWFVLDWCFDWCLDWFCSLVFVVRYLLRLFLIIEMFQVFFQSVSQVYKPYIYLWYVPLTLCGGCCRKCFIAKWWAAATVEKTLWNYFYYNCRGPLHKIVAIIFFGNSFLYNTTLETTFFKQKDVDCSRYLTVMWAGTSYVCVCC